MTAPVQRPLLRKERERLVKRQEIIVAARAVFASKGYENATLDQIAGKADFAKATLYNYFDNKECLLAEILESLLAHLEEIARDSVHGEGTVQDQFRRYALRTIEYYKANEDMLCILTRELSKVQHDAGWGQLMKRIRDISAVLANGLRKAISHKTIVREDPQELALVFIGMIHNRLMRRLYEDKCLSSFDAERESKFLGRLFFHGCALA
jgi:AcrR family transcriptional regulator